MALEVSRQLQDSALVMWVDYLVVAPAALLMVSVGSTERRSHGGEERYAVSAI